MKFECSIDFRENTNSLWHKDWIPIENLKGLGNYSPGFLFLFDMFEIFN